MAKIVNIHCAIISNYKDYDVLITNENNICLGKRKNYDNCGHYDNTDNSLIFISKNNNMFYLLSGEGWVLSQKEMTKSDTGFKDKDYKEFHKLKRGALKQFKCIHNITFKGNAFTYPYYN